MLNRVVKEAKCVAIAGHIHPDGDCVGSTNALFHYLKALYPEKQIDVYLETIPDCFCFLKGTEEIHHEILKAKSYDVFFALDCGSLDRLGFAQVLFENAKYKVCIDHHISNQGIADENYIEPEASSTCEVLYQFLEKRCIPMDTAKALYLGLVHDTGVFQYSCAGPKAFRMAADLLEMGVDASNMIHDTYYAKSYARMQVTGYALLNSILMLDGRCIVSVLRKRDMDFFGVQPKDLDGIVSQMRDTRGTEVSLFLYEIEPNVYKVSLRSGDLVNVSSIAQKFGGGGHVKAAGLTMPGSPYDVINNITALISEQLEAE